MSENPRPREVPPSGEDEYRRLFDEALDAILLSDSNGLLLDINPAGLRLFGYGSRDEIRSIEVASLYWNPERQRRRNQQRLQGAVDVREVELRSRSGQRLRAREKVTPIYGEGGEIVAVRHILQDVTERKRLEEELRQAQKMATVGRLAEGVAHDFNNLLTAITGYSELILVQTSADDPSRAGMEEVRRAGRRAADLTRRLLTLSQIGRAHV